MFQLYKQIYRDCWLTLIPAPVYFHLSNKILKERNSPTPREGERSKWASTVKAKIKLNDKVIPFSLSNHIAWIKISVILVNTLLGISSPNFILTLGRIVGQNTKKRIKKWKKLIQLPVSKWKIEEGAFKIIIGPVRDEKDHSRKVPSMPLRAWKVPWCPYVACFLSNSITFFAQLGDLTSHRASYIIYLSDYLHSNFLRDGFVMWLGHEEFSLGISLRLEELL